MEERFVPLGDDLGRIGAHMRLLTEVAGEGFSAFREEITSGVLGDLDQRAQSALALVQRQLRGMEKRLVPLDEVCTDLSALRSYSRQLSCIGTFLLPAAVASRWRRRAARKRARPSARSCGNCAWLAAQVCELAGADRC